MSESETAIAVDNVSRLFKRFRRPRFRLMDAFGLPLPRNSYDEFWALRGVSLELQRGDSLGIIGHNGAGKSTLLNIICGRLQPTSGSVAVRGRVQALMDLGTGFHPEFTGRQNVLSALAYQDVTGAAAQRRLDEIVDFSELAEFIDQPVKTYSAGMYARLAFATATTVEPDVLIVDEVLGAGDAYFAAKCADRMRYLTRGTGATVLFVSHDMSAVERLCERALWLDHGRVNMAGPVLEVSKSYYAEVTAREEARLQAQTTAAVSRMRQARDGSPLDAEIAAPAAAAPAGGPERAPAVRDKWHTAEARFLDVSVGAERDEGARYTFAPGETIVFRIEAELHVPVPRCWIAMIVLDDQGNRMFLGVHEFADGLPAGSNELTLRLQQPNLRQGEYLVSFELLPCFDYHWRGATRMPYLCHWDRCVHFRIDEGYHGTIELGRMALSLAVSARKLTQPLVEAERVAAS